METHKDQFLTPPADREPRISRIEYPRQLNWCEFLQRLSACPQDGRLVLAFYRKDLGQIVIKDEAIENNGNHYDNKIVLNTLGTKYCRRTITPSYFPSELYANYGNHNVFLWSKHYDEMPVIDVVPFVDGKYQYIAVVVPM